MDQQHHDVRLRVLGHALHHSSMNTSAWTTCTFAAAAVLASCQAGILVPHWYIAAPPSVTHV
jgi:hypothetical protein